MVNGVKMNSPVPSENFAYKAFQEFIVEENSVDAFTAKLDKEWEVEASQFNPTK
jgi:hypothetical protein